MPTEISVMAQKTITDYEKEEIWQKIELYAKRTKDAAHIQQLERCLMYIDELIKLSGKLKNALVKS